MRVKIRSRRAFQTKAFTLESSPYFQNWRNTLLSPLRMAALPQSPTLQLHIHRFHRKDVIILQLPHPPILLTTPHKTFQIPNSSIKRLFSHTNKWRLQLKTHLPPLRLGDHISCTVASWLIEMVKRLWNLSIKGTSPLHATSQKFVVAPLLTLLTISSLNQSTSSPFASNTKSFHHHCSEVGCSITRWKKEFGFVIVQGVFFVFFF